MRSPILPRIWGEGLYPYFRAMTAKEGLVTVDTQNSLMLDTDAGREGSIMNEM